MVDSSTSTVNQPTSVPSESTHYANQPLQNQSFSPGQLTPQNLNQYQLSDAAESIKPLIASLPPDQPMAELLSLAALMQANPSPPKYDASASNFRRSLSQPPVRPGLGSLINDQYMQLNQIGRPARSSSQPAALNINNQLPSAGSESSIDQQPIAWQLTPDQISNWAHEMNLAKEIISQSQLPAADSRYGQLNIPRVQALLNQLQPAYTYPDSLPPAPAYGQALSQDSSNHGRNIAPQIAIDIAQEPDSSTVNAASRYPPPPSVSPPVTQYQVSNPMVAALSFGNLPNQVMTVVQPAQILQDVKETQQSPVPPTQPSVQPPPPPSPKHSPEHRQENPNPPLPSPNEPVSAQITAPQLGPRHGALRKKNAAIKAANLANLLPTGTVLAFQSIVPSLSNSGKCDLFNRYLIGFVIAFCAATCFLSSFTDSFEHVNGKLYYGFATCNGLCVLNYENRTEEELYISKELEKLKIEIKDFIHAFGSLFVFLIFAISSSEVLSCYFPQAGEDDKYSVVVYLPLVAGVLSSFLFSIFPTKRKGFGSSDYSRP